MSGYPALPMSDLSEGGNSSNSNGQITTSNVTDPFDRNYTSGATPNTTYSIEQPSSEGGHHITKLRIYNSPNTGSNQSVESVTGRATDDNHRGSNEQQAMEVWRPPVSPVSGDQSNSATLEDGIRVSDRALTTRTEQPAYDDANYDGNSDAGKQTHATERSFDNENVGKRDIGVGSEGDGGRSCRRYLLPIALLLALLLCLAIAGFVYYLLQFQNSQRELQRLNSTVSMCDVPRDDIADSCAPLRAANEHLSDLNMQLNGTVIDLQTDNQNLLDEVGRLHNQLDQLLTNIEGLDGDVNGLLDNLDEYKELNAQLNETIQELEQQNELLNSSNAWYADLNSQLNESVTELESQVEYLAEQNQIYAGHNDDLNATAQRLSEEVDRLAEQASILAEENDNLENSVNNLSNEVDELRGLNEALGNSTSDLEIQVDRLTNEINRLEDVNGDLENVVSFLNETANEFDETYEAITSFLSEQITAYRRVVIETLQNTYTQRIANWDCAYRDMFRLEDFVNDFRLPIGAAAYPEVMEYVDERVLSELCLSRQDYETYLDNRWVQQGAQPPVSATTSELVTSIQLYTMAAMNYYFPDSDAEGGLSQIDWSEAGYTCDNLPADKRFSM